MDLMSDNQNAKRYFGRADIDAVQDRPTDEVEVPQWGGAWVRIRAMSAQQRATVTGTMIAVDGADVKIRAKEIGAVQLMTVASCLVEADGSPSYREDEYALLGERNAGAIETIYAALNELSGLGEDAIEEAVENFDETPTSSSPSS